MRVTPKSLILDLLSTCGRHSAPVRALVSAAALFGIADNALRVALARLRSDGLVVSDARGRYRLGPSAQAVNRQITSWRQTESRLVPWSGDWIGVQSTGEAPRGGRTSPRRRRALRLLGFRALSPGFEIRPDNLAGGVDAVREQLRDLGLDRSSLVFGVNGFDADTDAAARALWDGESWRADTLKLIGRLERSGARLKDLPAGLAMRESFEVGGEGIRHIVTDPLLPAPIVAGEPRSALIAAMCEYDRLGRHHWAGWLGGEAKPDQMPAGVELNSAESFLRDRKGV